MTLMVLNHIAVRLVANPAPKAVVVLAFVGSFAPVLFFFLTGLGSGIQSVNRPATRGGGSLIKILVLLAADSILWAKPGVAFGLDFFGFIGLSMLALGWLQRLPRSGALAAGLAVAAVLARFVVAPKLGVEGGGLAWLLGAEAPPGFSYALCPWAAYPFMGFVLGCAVAKWGLSPVIRRLALLMLVGGFFGVAAWVLVARGAELFRWVTMSSAYFLASLAALSASLALAIVLPRIGLRAALIKAISLSGVRSFAVVPLHYALLEMWLKVFGQVARPEAYLAIVLAILVASFILSALIPMAAAALETPARRRIAWAAAPPLVCASYLIITSGSVDRELGVAVRTATQLALCVLLASRLPTSAAVPTKAQAQAA